VYYITNIEYTCNIKLVTTCIRKNKTPPNPLTKVIWAHMVLCAYCLAIVTTWCMVCYYGQLPIMAKSLYWPDRIIGGSPCCTYCTTVPWHSVSEGSELLASGSIAQKWAHHRFPTTLFAQRPAVPLTRRYMFGASVDSLTITALFRRQARDTGVIEH